MVPEAVAFQPLGALRLSLTPVADCPVLLVNVTVTCCEEPGVEICSPVGVAAAEAGAMIKVGKAYLAATTFAWINWWVASVGKVFAAVTAPS